MVDFKSENAEFHSKLNSVHKCPATIITSEQTDFESSWSSSMSSLTEESAPEHVESKEVAPYRMSAALLLSLSIWVEPAVEWWHSEGERERELLELVYFNTPLLATQICPTVEGLMFTYTRGIRKRFGHISHLLSSVGDRHMIFDRCHRDEEIERDSCLNWSTLTRHC